MKYQEIVINGLTTRQVPSYPNYSVSQCGRVFRISKRKEMSRYKRKSGDKLFYWEVRTCHNNVAKCVKVCRMVAEAWVHNPDKTRKIHVNHKNSDTLDDSVDNLEWCTPSENMNHGIRHGNKQTGCGLYNGQLTDAEVHDICRLLKDGLIVKDIAEKFNVSKDIIRKIRAGDTYFHVRCLYDIEHNYRHEFSESTVRWVCSKVVEGWSDKEISDKSKNKNLTIIDIKRIRYGIRYYDISKEYFKDLCPTTNLYGVGGKLSTSEMEDTLTVESTAGEDMV